MQNQLALEHSFVQCATNLLSTYLELELHLTWLRAIHLDLLQNLIILRVRGLANVLDSPCKTCLERTQSKV